MFFLLCIILIAHNINFFAHDIKTNFCKSHTQSKNRVIKCDLNRIKFFDQIIPVNSTARNGCSCSCPISDPPSTCRHRGMRFATSSAQKYILAMAPPLVKSAFAADHLLLPKFGLLYILAVLLGDMVQATCQMTHSRQILTHLSQFPYYHGTAITIFRCRKQHLQGI